MNNARRKSKATSLLMPVLALGITIVACLASHAQSTPDLSTPDKTKSLPESTSNATESRTSNKDQSQTDTTPSQNVTQASETNGKGEDRSQTARTDTGDAGPVIHVVNHPPASSALTPAEDGLPLIIGGEEILRFKATISGFTPVQRIAAIDERVKKLLAKPDFNPSKISLIDTGFSTDIVNGESIILTVTDRDAKLDGFKDRNELAKVCAEKLTRTLAAEKLARSPKVIFIALASTAVATIVLIIVLLMLSAIFPRVYTQIELTRGKYIRSLKIQKAELLSEEALTEVVIGFCRAARGVVTVLVLLIYIERVLSFFPTTRYLSSKIVDETILPVVTVAASSIASYFPNLLIIALISASTYYLITFTHFIFREIARGKITIADFDPEWADPTYKIARFLVIAFSLVLIFPYLPGSGSPAFQQISIFLGVLISLGSSGAVSNIVAGVFLTYTGAFRIGDRVKISDTTGDVVERKLLYTRIRSIKDEYITVPNSMVLGAHIINYSSSTRQNGLILHTAVTIGYDVPWQKVQELLIAAALATEGVLHEPSPFVLVTDLNDFYVTHEINCYTDSPHMMAVIYANIHKSILDEFTKADVEIMSPHYTSLRRGDKKALPPLAPSEAPAGD